MDVIKYCFERIYPYIIAILLTKFIYSLEMDIMVNQNLNELLEGVITIDSIIIGFLGALLPVITSLKAESEFVKYVFEADKQNLFAKYIKATIQFGFISAGITLVMFLRDSIANELAKVILLYFWIFVTIAFLALTYRCMGHMSTLMFEDYKKWNSGENIDKKEKSAEELAFEEKHKQDF